MITSIIAEYNSDDRTIISSAYGDSGIDPLFPRLERAAINQVKDGTATILLYGIWANTVLDNLREALLQYEAGQPQESSRIVK
ncbi:MAG: hypothetical protein ACYDBB_27205 [Armatimonadota bacterium]